MMPIKQEQTMQQKVLVLGAGGFIGTEVVAALAATGWATPILGVRRPPRAGGRFQHRIVDATNLTSVASALDGVAAVVDCVAGGADTIAASNAALFGAVTAANRGIRVMHLSSMAVYGSAVGLVDESSPVQGDLGPYSVAKIAAERAALGYAHTTAFRPGCVYGPTSPQWSIRIAQLLLARRLGDLGPAGDGSCNLVHVADVASAIIRALQQSQTQGQIFNLSMPDPPTWNEYLIRYAKALRAVPVKRIHGRNLRVETKLLAPLLKILEIAAGKLKMNAGRLPPPIPPSLLRLFAQDIRLDTRRAETALGMRWRPLDTALQETADSITRRDGARGAPL
jgi:2-alkyl-3-oxoalkanoate reductase